MLKSPFFLLFTLFLLASCDRPVSDESETAASEVRWWTDASDEQRLDSTQRQAFRYFWDYAEPVSGLARERFHPGGDYPQDDAHIVTSGGTGFGVMAILSGVERGYISRGQAVERLRKIVDFLERADRFHGIWPHWLNGETGEVKPFSPKDDGADIVESAFLAQGLLCVRQYFRDGDEAERALAADIDTLWRAMNWNWHTRGEHALYWHWSPNYGWEMDFNIQGYNECLIAFVLGAASPTHPIDPEVYHEGWARDGDIVANDSFLGYARVLDYYSGSDAPVGPLFWAHYSYLGLDPRGLKDQYGDYERLNRNHALMHYAYCVRNPESYEGYGADCWGLTSSYTRREDGSVGYAGHRPGADRGVISPTAAVSSIPYTPKESMQAIRGFYEDYGDLLVGPAGFFDAFSPEYGWVAERYLAIDQGPIVVMIENHRSGMFWELFMSCPEVKEGLSRLGFSSPHL